VFVNKVLKTVIGQIAPNASVALLHEDKLCFLPRSQARGGVKSTPSDSSAKKRSQSPLLWNNQTVKSPRRQVRGSFVNNHLPAPAQRHGQICQ
jgi:hypothetical protein